MLTVFFSTANDFLQKSAVNATCKHSMDKGLKIVLQDSRSKISGWLPTNSAVDNQRYNCRSDLGSISVHHPNSRAEINEPITNGQSFSLAIEPLVIRSDQNIRRIAPHM